MIVKNVKVTNSDGLHARPAALFVQTAGKFTSDIWITKGERKVNAKSIMGLISLAISQGTEIMLGAEGEDEEQAISELMNLLTFDFKE